MLRESNDDETSVVALNEKAKVNAAAAKKIREEQAAKKKAEEEAKKAADEAEWEKAKADQKVKDAAKEEAEKAKVGAMSEGDAVLYAIEQLALRANEAEKQVERSERLEKVLGAEQAAAMKKRARRNSKDLEEQMQTLMESNLEKAFQQFDLDKSGTLDADELASAYKAAGMPMDPSSLKKAMRLLDTNGDGVIDLDGA